MKNGKISFTTTLDKALLKKIKIYCAKNEMNVNELLEKLLCKYLEKMLK